jgi:hypothetical protein
MGYKKIVLRIRPKMGKKADHFREVKRYPLTAGHRQGVGTVSKTAMGRFDSYGLCHGVKAHKDVQAVDAARPGFESQVLHKTNCFI